MWLFLQVECADIDTTTLGPNSKFLEIAREKRRKEDDERKQKLSKSSGPTQYSEEEKRRMAAQMVEDARQREEYIAKRGAQKSKELDDEELKANKNPHFLKYVQLLYRKPWKLLEHVVIYREG